MVFSDRGVPLGLRPDTVLVNGRPHLVTTSGAVVQTEEGQAGGGALMAQNGSLVFYLLQVNDVWAYFNTGMKNNKITNPTPTTFPTTGSAQGQITTVAQQAPAPFTKSAFPDNVAMAIEVKSSWIETTGLANVERLHHDRRDNSDLQSAADPTQQHPVGPVGNETDKACAGWHPCRRQHARSPGNAVGHVRARQQHAQSAIHVHHDIERSGHAAGGRTWRLVVLVDRRSACQSQ